MNNWDPQNLSVSFRASPLRRVENLGLRLDVTFDHRFLEDLGDKAAHRSLPPETLVSQLGWNIADALNEEKRAMKQEIEENLYKTLIPRLQEFCRAIADKVVGE
jgi:hypothetical protein